MVAATKVPMLEPVMPITTAEEKAQRRLEVKERSNLMMAIPNEHQLKFNSINDAKKLLKDVEKRFGMSSQVKHTEPCFCASLNKQTSSTNGAVNTAHRVSTASTQVNAANSTNIDNLSNAVIYKFVNKLVVENYKAMSIEEEHKVVRKNDDAPCIKEWVSNNDEEDVSQPKTEKKIVRPSIVKNKFVKSKQQEKSARKTVKQGNPQIDLQDQGVMDSGCSRHMIGNMSYYTDYEEIDRGYVAFGGNPKGGKITRKYTIKTGTQLIDLQVKASNMDVK
ncbi:hypothetical protein Tco_0205647 [Tanacetum coccineum]